MLQLVKFTTNTLYVTNNYHIYIVFLCKFAQ